VRRAACWLRYLGGQSRPGSWWQRLGLQRQILVAAARALAQLLLVGAALTLVISPSRPIWWSWLWVAAMLGYAATVARRRAPEVPHLLGLAVASFTAAAVLTLGVLFGLHVFPLTGRILVPIAGMMVGNSMTATVLAGVAPLQAVLVQAVVMFLVLAATTTVVIALGLIRRLFTQDHRLVYLPTPTDH
jgi:ABC-type iron transport system FetAB permease component